MESQPSPQVTRHDNVYAADSSPSIIKFESLAGQDNISALEVTGWVIFALILVMLTIPVIRAILWIMRMCQHKTESYNLDSSPSVKDSEEKYNVTYVSSLHQIFLAYTIRIFA